MIKLTAITATFALLAVAAATAETDPEIFILPAINYVSIDDPAGDIDDAVAAPFNLRWQIPAGYDRAWYTESGYISDTSIDADEASPAITYDGWHIGAGHAWRFRATRELKPWVSVGLRVASIDYADRYLVDGEGYRTDTLPDRSATEYMLAAGIANTWNISGPFHLGVFAEYAMPVSSDMSSSGLGLVLGYSFSDN